MERSGEEEGGHPPTKQGDEHLATLNVSFVQAIAKPEKEPHFHESFRDGQRKKIYDGLAPEHYFHYEYQLLPTKKGHQGQVFKTDVVVFGGVVSKVYTDKDNRVVQCWSSEEAESGEEGVESGEEGCLKLNHFGWRHKHTFGVNKSLLLDLYNHELEVKVWTTKSKLSARAKYDRPKAFRLPTSTSKNQSESEGRVTPERSVRRPTKLPVVSHDKVRAYKGGRSLKQASNASVHAAPSAQSLDSEGSVGDMGLAQREVKGDTSPIPEETSENKAGQLAIPATSSNGAGCTATTERRVLSRRTLRRLEAEAAEHAREEREGLVSLRLSLADIFSKGGVISTRLDDPIKSIQGLEVTISVATPLMPDHLLRELNPLTITVVKATGLPNHPVSHQQLRKKCSPVYTKYQFGSCPAHKSKPHPHSHSINLNDFHVLLLGTFDPMLLVELLRGPPLLVELHDRDRRVERNIRPALFGQERRDVILGTHGFGGSCVEGEAKPWDPYGVARVDLSGLLLGQRIIQLKCPVTCGPRNPSHCSSPNPTSMENCSLSTSLPPGDYLGSHCELSVVVELTHPLSLSPTPTSAPLMITSPQTTPTRPPSKTTPTIPASKTTPTRPASKTTPKKSPKVSSKTRKKKEERENVDKSSCPFNRLVYVISAEGKSLVRELLMKVNEINAKALGFEDLPEKMWFAALSTYKLTREQMSSGSCDVITGFHVEDWEQHIVVLEGLGERGVSSIWKQLPHHSSQDNRIIKVLYNSGYSFSHRLYATLDVDLPHISLYQPLSELTQQSLIYVKDTLSHKVFRCLMCLSSLTVVDEMSELYRNDLFPSPDQIAALSLQFAQPPRLDSADLSDLSDPSDLRSSSSLADPAPVRPLTPDLQRASKLMSRRVRVSLDMTNDEFDHHLHERSQHPVVDFVKTNVLYTQSISEENKALPSSVARRRKKERQRSLSDSCKTVHIYSSQKLNSTELGQARLREELCPQCRYTYSQCYHSMTVVPIDVEARERAQRLSSQRRWKTEAGFVYPGMDASLRDNAHKKQPDPARVHDLKQPFEDNLLHANTLRPSVDRLEFSWERRGDDFERWKAPPLSIGRTPPTTIHLAGESRNRELHQYEDNEHERWRDKLVVKDTNFYTHRQGIRSELSQGASCQLDKLQGVLKDRPNKYSLRREGLSFSPTPALSVVHDPGVDANVNILNVSDEGELTGGGGAESHRGYAPGPDQSKSLKRDCNRIPRYGRGTGGCGEDTKVNQLHGNDFRLYYHLPTLLYKRPSSRQAEPEGKQEVPLVVSEASTASLKHVLVEQTTS